MAEGEGGKALCPYGIPESWIEAVNGLKLNLVTEDGFSHMCMGITVRFSCLQRPIEADA